MRSTGCRTALPRSLRRATASTTRLLLDLGLPRQDGLQVLRNLRRAGFAAPILIITARDEIRDRVHGLDSGADDFIVKPFDMDELGARLRAAHRRACGRAAGGARAW